MATSKFSKGKWTAGALVYSGRRDPIWPIPGQLAQRLVKIWSSAERWTGDFPTQPPLGYRGCFLRDSENRQWYAFGGVITLSAGQATESRGDPERKFEKLLVTSSPRGALPPGL